MPHLVIDYSTDGHGDGFDIAAVMQAVHETAAATGVPADDVKIRASAHADYLVAGGRHGFCHVSVYPIGGRSPAQKIALSEAVLETLTRILPHTRSLSVDLRDMDPIAYRRRLNPAG